MGRLITIDLNPTREAAMRDEINRRQEAARAQARQRRLECAENPLADAQWPVPEDPRFTLFGILAALFGMAVVGMTMWPL